MSATFKNAKKKLSQSDLRKIMKEHQKKPNEVKKIDSPLAKYNEHGQLTCVLCQSIVRSEAVWTIHISAKQHKQNVEMAKKLKEKTNNFTTPLKRPLTPPLPDIPDKKLKSILKNGNQTQTIDLPVTRAHQNLPSDFFDNNIKTPTSAPKNKVEEQTETLPEGFFDDPKLDAKARNQEYKDPGEEEWEKFVKEIREADNASAAIIAEDQEESTTERQIDEIDEQMKKLNKVLDLEKKKAKVVAAFSDDKNKNSEEDEELLDNVDFDEFLDWRKKQSFT
ncbi:zinc finger protein 830 [Cylas formicarius]|uniref:zinc finger protein 830 n=1 Tax=Cylas formicarius TaxID=197179 RepID=UPI002958CE45|nr:zinc finger protein 830 [Cylas formicarius]